MPENLFSDFPKIGSWQFFAGWIIGGLLLWAIVWSTPFSRVDRPLTPPPDPSFRDR